MAGRARRPPHLETNRGRAQVLIDNSQSIRPLERNFRSDLPERNGEAGQNQYKLPRSCAELGSRPSERARAIRAKR